jgi:hypothetical protein
VDDHFAPAAQTDDSFPADLAQHDCWADSSPDDCSLEADYRAAFDSSQDYSSPAVHCPRADSRRADSRVEHSVLVVELASPEVP